VNARGTDSPLSTRAQTPPLGFFSRVSRDPSLSSATPRRDAGTIATQRGAMRRGVARLPARLTARARR